MSGAVRESRRTSDTLRTTWLPRGTDAASIDCIASETIVRSAAGSRIGAGGGSHADLPEGDRRIFRRQVLRRQGDQKRRDPQREDESAHESRDTARPQRGQLRGERDGIVAERALSLSERYALLPVRAEYPPRARCGPPTVRGDTPAARPGAPRTRGGQPRTRGATPRTRRDPLLARGVTSARANRFTAHSTCRATLRGSSAARATPSSARLERCAARSERRAAHSERRSPRSACAKTLSAGRETLSPATEPRVPRRTSSSPDATPRQSTLRTTFPKVSRDSRTRWACCASHREARGQRPVAGGRRGRARGWERASPWSPSSSRGSPPGGRTRDEIHSRLEAGRGAARDDAPAAGSRDDAAREHVAADVIDDHVGAPLVGEALHLGDEVLRRVVDDVVGAELARPLHLRVGSRRGDDARPVELGDLDGGARHAAACGLHEDRLPGTHAPLRDDHLPRGEKHERQGRGLRERQITGIGQEVGVGDVHVLGVAAADVLPEDRVAGAEVVLAREAPLAHAARDARADDDVLPRLRPRARPGPSASSSPTMSLPSRCG